MVKYLTHGVNLLKQPDSDICDCMEMLFLLQLFGRTAATADSKSLIAPTLECLATKDLPNSLDDFYNSLVCKRTFDLSICWSRYRKTCVDHVTFVKQLSYGCLPFYMQFLIEFDAI